MQDKGPLMEADCVTHDASDGVNLNSVCDGMGFRMALRKTGASYVQVRSILEDKQGLKNTGSFPDYTSHP